MSRKEATIGDGERAELEAIVEEAHAAARRRIYEHASDCFFRRRGGHCTCAVAYGASLPICEPQEK